MAANVSDFVDMPIQYAAIFKGYENYNRFDEKNKVSFFYAQNIEQVPIIYISEQILQHTSNVNPCIRQFYYIIIKVGCKGVFITRTFC